MQDCTVRPNPSRLPVKWCHWGLLCLLLLTFNSAAFAQSHADSHTEASNKQTSTVTLLTNPPSATVDFSPDDPDVDDAIQATVQIRIDGSALSPSVHAKQSPPLNEWLWHPVRGPPTYL